MERKIKGFFGEYRFLSNFWYSPVKYDFEEYKTVEHAYQASKFLNLSNRKTIQLATTPAQAKQLGRNFELREDWEEYKLKVMLNLLKQKFLIPDLRDKLIATGDAYLEETNNWNDTYWGVSDGKGLNMLGNMLMHIRKKL